MGVAYGMTGMWYSVLHLAGVAGAMSFPKNPTLHILILSSVLVALFISGGFKIGLVY